MNSVALHTCRGVAIAVALRTASFDQLNTVAPGIAKHDEVVIGMGDGALFEERRAVGDQIGRLGIGVIAP